jgi:hypothetical protein
MSRDRCFSQVRISHVLLLCPFMTYLLTLPPIRHRGVGVAVKLETRILKLLRYNLGQNTGYP